MACAITSEQAAAIFATQSTQLYGQIGASLPVDVPYIDVLDKGTYPAAVAATLTSVVQGRAAAGDSLVAPTFSAMTSLCDNGGLTDQTGTNHYNYSAKVKTGISERICFGSGYHAFRDALLAQTKSLEELVKEYINADVRWELFTRSGVKAVVQSSKSHYAMISGGYNQIDTAIPAIEADGRLTHALLQKFASYMREVLKVKMFGSGTGASLKFIASWDLLEAISNDLGTAASGVITPWTALVQSGDRTATDAVKAYAFTPTFRGIQYAKDQQPLRADWTGAEYAFIEPEIVDAATAGNQGIPNPAWLEAGFEVSFLFGQGSFERQVPAPWTGEGKTRFARQMFGGEIQFISNRDMGCNMFGDQGVLAYRIGRAYRPLRPWFVLPIISKRCQDPTDVIACSGISGA